MFDRHKYLPAIISGSVIGFQDLFFYIASFFASLFQERKA